jgi:hypothetical protein
MSNDIVTVRMSREQAAFLRANLALLARTTRDAMSRPGLEPDRRVALGSRASLLERTEDAVCSAMLEVPTGTRKTSGSGTVATRQSPTRLAQDFVRVSAA